MKLTDPIFHDANVAREWFEAQRWPHGPICPHCNNPDQTKIAALGTQKSAKNTHARPGLYKCYVPSCRKQFSVQVGTVMERSHVPLNLWALAMFIMAGAKKGTSARQMSRMMGLKSMKTIWFLCHRIREAMKPDIIGPLGGEGKTVEADESFIGGKEANKHVGKRRYRGTGGAGKQAVFTLVERDGNSHSFHVNNVTGDTLRPYIVTLVSGRTSDDGVTGAGISNASSC